ncbi:MAG: DmsC/YnfH family molybdoenzyme membrane anchor subunit [Pseudomonadota bacterium]|nr:DmsC/YnfH family molybdoenzyme membrane anchor subunit [Pseudomonadota bacterium]
MNPAYSVIFFTTASGAGYGLIFLLALFGALNGVPIDPWFGAIGLGLGTALVTGGLLSSTIHLGHPERAWRAYSQWRSSWLSREGVLATTTYVPLILTAWGWVIMGAIDGNFAFIAALLALMCVLTVHSTGMIYATLRTISAWHNRLTVPGYLAFALLSGSAWFHALAQIFGYQTPEIALVVIVALFLCFYIKRKYWRSIDMYPGPSTPESATGLHDLGKVQLLDPPTMTENFVQREMGYTIARKHGQKLRRLCFISYFLIPIVLTGLTSNADSWLAVPGTLVAAISVSVGVTIERWLFFAEAKHVSMLYYGADSA